MSDRAYGDTESSSSGDTPRHPPLKVPGRSAFSKGPAKRVGRPAASIEPVISLTPSSTSPNVSPATSFREDGPEVDLNGTHYDDPILTPPPAKKPKLGDESTDIIDLTAKENAQLRADLVKLQGVLDAVLEDVRTKTTEINSLNHMTTVLEQCRQSRDQLYDDALSSLRARDEELNVSQNQKAELLQQLAQAQARFNVAQTEIESFQRRTVELESRLSENESARMDLTAKVVALETQLAEVTQRAQDESVALKKENQMLNVLAEQGRKSAVEVTQLKAQMEVLQTQLRDMSAASMDDVVAKNPDSPFLSVVRGQIASSMQENSTLKAQMVELKVALESRTQKATNQKKKIKKLKASLKEESRQREKFEAIAFSRSAQNDSEKRELEDKLHRQQKISDELERELAYLKQPTASVAAQSLTAENARLTREMEELKDKTQKRIEEEQNKTEELKAKMQKRIEEEQNKRINLEYRSREWTDRIQALQRDLDHREREVRDARRELQQGNMHAQQLLTAVALQQHAQPPVANPHAAHYALPPPQSAYNPTPTGAYAGHAGALSGGYHPPARRSRASVVEQNTD